MGLFLLSHYSLRNLILKNTTYGRWINTNDLSTLCRYNNFITFYLPDYQIQPDLPYLLR